jgi:hypothetical protein
MGCNKDYDCLKLANETYPSLQSEIFSSLSTVSSQINGIGSKLMGLSIPNDSLGERIKSRIGDICSYLNNDNEIIDNLINSVNKFVDEKEIEHKDHYDKWKAQQQRTDKPEPVDNTAPEEVVNYE